MHHVITWIFNIIFSDKGCLWLQHVLWCIKCHQGSKRQREPVTIELMHIIFQSLNFYKHTMLWAACCLGFFGFSHALEFTINSHFNPDVHIAVSDVQAESLVNSGYVSDLYTHSHHLYHGGSRPTHLTGITCASFFFPSCFCRVPQDFGGSGPGLPSTLSPSLPLQTGMGSSESPFSLEWGLIAGLRGFASHGGSILSRG